MTEIYPSTHEGTWADVCIESPHSERERRQIKQVFTTFTSIQRRHTHTHTHTHFLLSICCHCSLETNYCEYCAVTELLYLLRKYPAMLWTWGNRCVRLCSGTALHRFMFPELCNQARQEPELDFFCRISRRPRIIINIIKRSLKCMWIDETNLWKNWAGWLSSDEN